MTLIAFLEHFHGVRTVGRRWTAECPAHEDRSRNTLHISLGADGRRLLICRAGCLAADILAAATLTWADLFAEGAARTAAGRPARDPWSLEALLRMQLRRARERQAEQAAIYPTSDAIRKRGAAVRAVRALVSRLGPDDARAWELAAAAADVERDLHCLEADQDQVLRELRRR